MNAAHAIPPHHQQSPYHRVLCPIDFSEPSRRAMLRAAEEAHRWGAALELLHVYQPPHHALPGYAPDPNEMGRLLTAIDRALAEWAGWARSLGCGDVATRSVQGSAWREIVARASEGDFDLIFIGTHGQGGFRQALLGSVTERVVRHAPCDVLTLRADGSHPSSRRPPPPGE